MAEILFYKTFSDNHRSRTPDIHSAVPVRVRAGRAIKSYKCQGFCGFPYPCRSDESLPPPPPKPTVPESIDDISEAERKYLLTGSHFETTEEKEAFIDKSSDFDTRLKFLLSKREDAARKVLSRFEGNLKDATDRWSLKAPPLDLKYLLEGEPDV